MTEKARVTTVQIGNLQVEGLMFPDGSFGIAIPQIQSLFDDILSTPNYAAQSLKRIMGKDFSTHKGATELGV